MRKAKKKTLHPKTEKLISRLRDWCDRENGRRSQAAAQLGVSPGLMTDWLEEYRLPSINQGFEIEEFLAKHRK
jgi:hypothetical protein